MNKINVVADNYAADNALLNNEVWSSFHVDFFVFCLQLIAFVYWIIIIGLECNCMLLI